MQKKYFEYPQHTSTSGVTETISLGFIDLNDRMFKERYFSQKTIELMEPLFKAIQKQIEPQYLNTRANAQQTVLYSLDAKYGEIVTSMRFAAKQLKSPIIYGNLFKNISRAYRRDVQDFLAPILKPFETESAYKNLCVGVILGSIAVSINDFAGD